MTHSIPSVKGASVSPSPTVITVHDQGGTFTVTITDQISTRLSASFPSGRLAGYAEARARCLGEAVEKVRKHVERLRTTYRTAEVVGLDALDAADPESLVRGSHPTPARAEQTR
jgi:ribosomal protein S12 methylthiotransferase accessory factor YcaO